MKIIRFLLILPFLLIACSHAWVADGYHILSVKWQERRVYNTNPIREKIITYDVNTCKIHMRWGEHGYADGYFSPYDPSTCKGEEYIAIHQGNF